MKRSRTTSFAEPPPVQAAETEPATAAASSWRELAPVAAALIAILEVTETSPRSGPAMKAHRAALRRQGEAAARIGGREAMEQALRQVAEADPVRAEDRTTVIRASWAELSCGFDPEGP